MGGFLTTLGVFAGSFGYANTHLYVTNAPLQPATVAVADATTTSSTAATSATQTTTTLTSAVRTTTRAAVTVTKKS